MNKEIDLRSALIESVRNLRGDAAAEQAARMEVTPTYDENEPDFEAMREDRADAGTWWLTPERGYAYHMRAGRRLNW